MIDALGPAVIQFASQLAEERARRISRELQNGCRAQSRAKSTVANGRAARFRRSSSPGSSTTGPLKHQQRAEQQRRHILTDCAERTASLEATATAVSQSKPQIALLLIDTMLTGLSGSLLSHYFAERLLHVEFAGRLGEQSAADAHRTFRRWWLERVSQLGPASSLAIDMEHGCGAPGGTARFRRRNATERRRHAPGAVNVSRCAASALSQDIGRLRSTSSGAMPFGAALGSRPHGAFCTNGHQVRLVDTHRTYSRAFVQFDLQQAINDVPTFQVFWGVLRAEAFRVGDEQEPLDSPDHSRQSARHGQAVSRSLRFGVIESVQHLLTGLNNAASAILPRCSMNRSQSCIALCF